MEYFQQFIDLRRQDIDPEMFAIALAICHIRRLIEHGGSDMGRPDLELAFHPEHLKSFLARAVEIQWKDAHLIREWRKLQQVLPQAREAWEKVHILLREDFARATSNQESMGYISTIDVAVDGYAEVPVSRIYPDIAALRDCAINGYMLVWREHFLKIKKERIPQKWACNRGEYDYGSTL
jgi:hypothetical protein